MSSRVLGALLAAAVVVALWIGAGSAGVTYAVVFAVALSPGIPLGLALFGRRHPAAWIAGGLLGYGLTQLALWAAIALGLTSPAALAASWLLVLVAGIAAGGLVRDAPAIATKPWTVADVRALFLVLLLVPVLMGVPYRNLGREDSAGNRYYRAYFTADFVWHSALSYELGKFSLPPRNPYLAPRAMNYYWTYFLLPASMARIAPGAPGTYVQPFLKSNAMLAGLLMLAALFLLVSAATRSTGAAAAAVALAVVAASAEGLYAIVDLVRRGRPLAALQDTNIDAITAWSFNGLRIDNIPRSLWYTPQHTTSIGLGLTGLAIAVFTGVHARPAAIAAAGVVLGLSTTMNPLLGGVCALLYGVCIVTDAVATRATIAAVARHALAAVFVLAAVGWGVVSRVTDGAGSAVHIGFEGFSRNSPVITLLLSLGPVLVPALAGIWPVRTELERRAVVVASTGILVGLFLLYFVRISEASWVGFRAGQILLVSIPVLLARTLDRLGVVARTAVVGVILLVGLATTVVDTYNAQDISNRRPGPGFRWTLWTTAAQEEAFAWIRANTRDEDIVQMEPIVRGREHWTLIPSFAGRRMAAGQPISLLPIPEYRQRSEQVRAVFASSSAAEAWDVARKLRLDYLYVDGVDRAEYPEGTHKFDQNPGQFERVFANNEVQIYRVR